MSGFLLDTNVISMFSSARAPASARFVEWLDRMDSGSRIFISVVAIHEIEKSIALLEHKGAVAKAAGLKIWLAGLAATYDDKIFPVDAAAASLAGQLEAKAIAAGHDPGMADSLIAGIGQAHELVIITRNKKRFLPFGVAVATPDEAGHLS